jgi:hypothetical protein
MARKTVPTSRTRKLDKPGFGSDLFNRSQNSPGQGEAKPFIFSAVIRKP